MKTNWNNSSTLHFPVTCSTGEVCHNYREYLESSHWKNIRYRYYNSRLPKYCIVCFSSDGKNLHHKTYKRLGNERLNDFNVLCEVHHKQLHDLFLNDPEVRYGGLWSAWRKIRKIYRKQYSRGYFQRRRLKGCL